MSTQFTEEDIETLDDWNAVLGNGCCCTMPACPIPVQECESMQFDLDICGIVGADHFGQSKPAGAGSTYYLTKISTQVVDHSGSGIGPPPQHYERTQTTNYFYDDEYPVGTGYSGSCNSDYTDVTSGSSFCPFAGTGVFTYSVTGSAAAGYSISETQTIGAVAGDPTHSYVEVITHTYSDPITDQLAYLIGNGALRFAYLGWQANGSSCSSLIGVTATDADGEAISIDWRVSRYRWVIPDTFEGAYFKITWDVVFFPTTGDPVAVTTDATWEWTGPGDPEDADSWKSGWYEIPVPEEPGDSRIVNIRFECYAGPFGNRPQVTGEAYEYPPP